MSAECSAGNIPPGYKQTEVGVIPEDWDVVTTLDACSKIQDGTHFSPQISGNDYLYITSKNIRVGYLDISTASRIDTAQHQAIYRRCDVKKGDLLLTKDGASTGNAALNTLDEEFSLLSSVSFLRFLQSKYCTAYFLQQILTSSGQHQIQDAMAGNAITRLTLEKIKKLRFPVPPTLAEQEAIAEALSDADALIESLEQLIAKKRQIKQGAMQELLTGKRRLLGFSGKWETKLIGDVLTIAHGKSQHAVIDKNGIYPILATGGQIGTANCFLYDKPSVLIGRKGTIDKPQFMDTPFWTVDTLFYSVIHEPNNAKFLFYRFCLIDWKQYNEASGVPSLNARTIESIELKIPSSAKEQNAIASILSDMDSEITALEEKLAKTRQIKQGMMQELLTGRIRLV